MCLFIGLAGKLRKPYPLVSGPWRWAWSLVVDSRGGRALLVVGVARQTVGGDIFH